MVLPMRDRKRLRNLFISFQIDSRGYENGLTTKKTLRKLIVLPFSILLAFMIR
jgi:hypothetical protein